MTRKVGRPSTYNETITAEFCRRLAGGRSMRDVCSDEDMPCMDAIRDWRIKYEEFAAQYARARESRAEILADEIIAIADTEEDAARARNRIDARKWAASKLDRKSYGEHVEVAASHRIANVSSEALTEDEWARQYAVNRLATPSGTTESTD